uniref:Uncharacterized protein n=1 Tax=Sinocyclocheilus rhinocerous TaxID=307959 RepID=A0A673GP82_9TELE
MRLSCPSTFWWPLCVTFMIKYVFLCIHCFVVADAEGISATGVWDSMSVRHAFIRKVYLILAVQLLITTSIIAVFTFVEPVRLFVVQNPAIYWASL